MRAAKAITRVLALIGKEIVEVFRRPGAVASLVLGPFLILAIFGLGYSGYRRPLETVLVVPPESGLPADRAAYEELDATGFRVAGVATEEAAAEALLRDGRADVVVIAPPDLAERFARGEQSTIRVAIDQIDPVMANYATFLAQRLAAEANQEIIRRAVEEAQIEATAAGQSVPIPPEVVAEPTRAEVVNLAPSQPDVVGFFGPAALALILQHMAVTLVALSLVRERLTGIAEIFRIGPIHASEIILGKLAAYSVLNGVIAGVTVILLVAVLGVPLLGSPAGLAATIALLTIASVGLGLVVSVVSDSERQAVQLALLILLASVFFSGFVLPIEEFSEPVRIAAYALPVTHGIRLVQDVMLRGATDAAWQVVVLGGLGAGLVVLAWRLLRRELERA
ncbi:MAG TPA: ABC transporter permease [Candidatus Limnocylindrales bacterium]|nr:ABC transporter permease [Candidatus Limnocylindrales bacterium]